MIKTQSRYQFWFQIKFQIPQIKLNQTPPSDNDATVLEKDLSDMIRNIEFDDHNNNY